MRHCQGDDPKDERIGIDRDVNGAGQANLQKFFFCN